MCVCLCVFVCMYTFNISVASRVRIHYYWPSLHHFAWNWSIIRKYRSRPILKIIFTLKTILALHIPYWKKEVFLWSWSNKYWESKGWSDYPILIWYLHDTHITVAVKWQHSCMKYHFAGGIDWIYFKVISNWYINKLMVKCNYSELYSFAFVLLFNWQKAQWPGKFGRIVI